MSYKGLIELTVLSIDLQANILDQRPFNSRVLSMRAREELLAYCLSLWP